MTFVSVLQLVCVMVLLSYGNSDHVAHVWSKIGLFGENNPIWGCSRSQQMPWTDQITEITP